MNKILLFCIATVLVTSAVWGVDDTTEANSYISDIGYDPLPLSLNDKTAVRKAIGNNFVGMDVKFFAGYDPKNQILGSGLLGMNNAEVQAIRNGVWADSKRVNQRVTRAAGYYSIIGYSQGGLRALGYLTRLKASYPSDINKIDAAITISGADQGAKLLEGGFSNFKSRIAGKANIVNDGIKACAVAGTPLFGVIPPGLPLTKITNGYDFIFAISPPVVRSLVEIAWKTAVGSISKPVVDMVPESDYITQNVAKTEKYTYKVKTGTEFVLEIRYKKILGIKIPYISAGNKDVYKNYTANKVLPKFDTAVPVGFIVGTNSNTIGLAASVAGISESTVRGFIKAAEVQFGIAEGINLALGAGFLPPFVVYARDADRARQMMANIDKELNDLKRETANDGFLALESQYLPKTFTKPDTKATETVLKNPVLRGGAKGYVEMSNYNHKSIAENDATFKEARDMILEARVIRKR